MHTKATSIGFTGGFTGGGGNTRGADGNPASGDAFGETMGEFTKLVKNQDLQGIDRLLRTKFAGVHPRTWIFCENFPPKSLVFNGAW